MSSSPNFQTSYHQAIEALENLSILSQQSEHQIQLLDGDSVCPVCGSTEVREMDYDLRWNSTHSGYDADGVLIVSMGDPEHESLGFFCSDCWTPLSLPGNIDVEYA